MWYNFSMDGFTRYMTDLLKRQRYSMREASIAAGLSDEALSTLLRRWAREGAKPRPDTLNAIAQAIGGDLNTMLRLVGYQVPETPRATVPHLAEFVERLSKLPPEQQQRIMGAYLVLLEAQEAVNRVPESRLLPEHPPHDTGHAPDPS